MYGEMAGRRYSEGMGDTYCGQGKYPDLKHHELRGVLRGYSGGHKNNGPYGICGLEYRRSWVNQFFSSR
jgi:hypothetical protein